MSEKKFRKIETTSSEDGMPQRASSADIVRYATMISDPLASEAYVLSRRYDISEDVARSTIEFLGYAKAMEFTQLYFGSLHGGVANYMQAAKNAAANGFSVVEKETSLLDQERMNSESRFGINPDQRELEHMLKTKALSIRHDKSEF
ncbi:MAG: hypothetical protein NT120_02170 [Candidatus Aenigmarchaeota archaeon]|nr:hypothetical protein [Candidatus Aenigmarchaeota archaeon]